MATHIKLMCATPNSDNDIKIRFSKVDSPEKKQLWTYNKKTKHAKSGVCSRRINFRKQYFYIDIGVQNIAPLWMRERLLGEREGERERGREGERERGRERERESARARARARERASKVPVVDCLGEASEQGASEDHAHNRLAEVRAPLLGERVWVEGLGLRGGEIIRGRLVFEAHRLLCLST